MISIIVPVYNNEKWLSRCVDSILAQTYHDFELLLIDDGSTDNSGAICDQYAAQDARIRVFHKANGGVSSARNLGLDEARGEWICFVDSDDEVEHLEKFVLVDASSDMILMTLRVINWNGNDYLETISLQSGISDKKENYIKYFLQYHIFNSVCGKLIRRSVIGALRFDGSIKFGEDSLFNLLTMSVVNKITLCPEAEYIYHRENDYGVKYRSTVVAAASTMARIFTAYRNLGSRNRDFERNVFNCYRMICYQEWSKQPSLWNDNENVKEVYSRIKDVYPLLFRLKYWLSAGRLYTLYRKLKGDKQ